MIDPFLAAAGAESMGMNPSLLSLLLPSPGPSVLLYSGGLDSFLTSHLLKPDLNLYVCSESKYQGVELEALPVPPHGRLEIVRGALDLSRWERDDLIVPMRNAFLAMVAANYGNVIWLAATAGDRSADKNPLWARLTSRLLRQMWRPQHWTPGRRIRVELPVRRYSKTQLVAAYLRTGGDGDALGKLVSCYSGTSRGCGRCKPCVRKWVALENNRLSWSFDSAPLSSITPAQLEAARRGQHRGRLEDRDLVRAVERQGGLR